MIVLIFLHMGRTFSSAPEYPRELNWVIGVS